MDNSKVKEAFNSQADKVVWMGEFRAKTKALYKSELTLGEKIFLNAVDKPASVLAGVIIAVKDIAQKAKQEGAYIDPSAFRMYCSGAFMAAAMEKTEKTHLQFGSSFQAKINDIAARAFDACEDYSKKPELKNFKPV